MMIDTLRALTVAANSLRFNSEIDPDAAGRYEKVLTNLRDKLGRDMESNPLTLDELRKMDGEPVWVVPLRGKEKSEYALVNTEKEWLCTSDTDFWDFAVYGNAVIAYRRKTKKTDITSIRF